MSFSSELKGELAAIVPERDCCAAAQLYGMLEFGHAFSAADISLVTTHAEVAGVYGDLLERVCGVDKPIPYGTENSRKTLSVTLADDGQRRRVLERFGHTGRDVAVRLNRANLDCEECIAAYLRGAFLTGGTVADPSRGYHLEFTVPYYNLIRDTAVLLDEIGCASRQTVRRGNRVLYIKESRQMEELLTYIGAQRSVLELMNIQILKDVRNQTNRRVNCENANMDKTALAAAAQEMAIQKIEQHGGLGQLPEDLRVLAQLRLDNPDMTLRELGLSLEPPLSRSGVNHRMERILAYARDLH